jgi:ribosomal protein L30E
VLFIISPAVLLWFLCRNFTDNVDLGTACGKYYRVGIMGISDQGSLISFVT